MHAKHSVSCDGICLCDCGGSRGPPSREVAVSGKHEEGIVYNDMGWTSVFRYPGPSPMSPEEIVRATVTPWSGRGSKSISSLVTADTRRTTRSEFLTTIGIRRPPNGFYSALEGPADVAASKRLNVDPLALIAKACKENGIACQFSLQMGGADLVNKDNAWFAKHAGALLPDGQLTTPTRMRSLTARPRWRRCSGNPTWPESTWISPVLSLRFPGQYPARSNLASLVRDLREMARGAGKTFQRGFDSARRYASPPVWM